MTSPGASEQPARMPPQITACASVSALTMSPDLVMPPSARMVTRFFWAARERHIKRGHLRDAHAGHDARGADRAGALADFDRVGAAVGEELHPGPAGDVARDDRQLRKRSAQHAHRVAHALAVAVRGGDGHHIHAALDQRADVVEDAVAVQFAESVARGGDGGAADQAELGIARGLELGVALLR